MWFTPLLQGAAQQQAGAGQWQLVTGVAVSSGSPSGTTTATPSFAVSVGQLVVVAFGFETDSTASVADSAGNTYTALTRYSSNGPQWFQLFYTVATFASASNVVTATNSVASTYRNLAAQVFQPPSGTVALDTSSGGASNGVANLTGINVDPLTSGSSLVVFATKIFNTGTYAPGEIGWQQSAPATTWLYAMFQNVSDGSARPVGVKRLTGITTSYAYGWASFTITQAAIYRPTGDILTTGWTGTPDNVNLYNDIDEVVASDLDYILSPDVNATPGPATFSIGSAPAGTYVISLRAKRTASVGDIRALLKDSGGTTVGTSSWQTITGTFTTYNFSVTTTGTAAQLTIEVQP